MTRIVLDIIVVVFLVDFGSGLMHWLEDSYGRPEWPITGPLITTPNIVHHQRPAEFTKHSWLKSAQILIILGAVIVGIAWGTGTLTWQIVLGIVISVNANEIHKSNHLPRTKRAKLVILLQKLGLLQTPQHHAKHHRTPRDTHYCVVTNMVNPVLDTTGFWRGLEVFVEVLFGVSKRAEVSSTPAETGRRLVAAGGPEARRGFCARA